MPLTLQRALYYCQTALRSITLHITRTLHVGIGIIIILGILALMLKYAAMFVFLSRFKRHLKRSSRSPKKLKMVINRLNLKNKVQLVRNPRPVAFCFGVRRAKIYLSTGLVSLMNAKELEAILYHESYHIYRGSAKYWEETILISALTKLIKYSFSPAFRFSAIGRSDTLEQRIKALTGKTVKTRQISSQKILVTFLSLAFFISIILLPVKAVAVGDMDNKVMMVCIENDSCLTWCQVNHAVMSSAFDGKPASYQK